MTYLASLLNSTYTVLFILYTYIKQFFEKSGISHILKKIRSTFTILYNDIWLICSCINVSCSFNSLWTQSANVLWFLLQKPYMSIHSNSKECLFHYENIMPEINLIHVSKTLAKAHNSVWSSSPTHPIHSAFWTSVVWNVMPFSQPETYFCFEGTHYFHLLGRRL